MKPLLLLITLIVLAVPACRKERQYTNGMIIGIDYRKCASPMCSGWFLEVKNDTLRFLEIPEKTDINFNNGDLKFPIPVKVIYTRYTNDWKDIKDLIFVKEIWKR
jgi:hypothetical protein